MMRNITTKYLVWILAVWVGSWCMTLSSAAVAAEHQTPCMMSVEYHSADQVTYAAMPDRLKNGGDSIILNDQDAVDADAAAPTGLEDTQAFAFTVDVPGQCIAMNERVRLSYTASIVEPRFLRYGRLLI
jgi:hypothetical protein